jgi:hypothetical protein
MGSHSHTIPSPQARVAFAAAIAWSLGWKAASLWRAARNDSKPWFGVLLVVNTMGILDAVYLFGVDGARRRKDRTEESILARTHEPQQVGHTSET